MLATGFFRQCDFLQIYSRYFSLSIDKAWIFTSLVRALKFGTTKPAVPAALFALKYLAIGGSTWDLHIQLATAG